MFPVYSQSAAILTSHRRIISLDVRTCTTEKHVEIFSNCGLPSYNYQFVVRMRSDECSLFIIERAAIEIVRMLYAAIPRCKSL